MFQILSIYLLALLVASNIQKSFLMHPWIVPLCRWKKSQHSACRTLPWKTRILLLDPSLAENLLTKDSSLQRVSLRKVLGWLSLWLASFDGEMFKYILPHPQSEMVLSGKGHTKPFFPACLHWPHERRILAGAISPITIEAYAAPCSDLWIPAQSWAVCVCKETSG